MDWHATTFTAQVCLLRSTLLKQDVDVYAKLNDLQHTIDNINEDEPDDPLYVYQWVWHNGKVGTQEMTFLAFLAQFVTILADTKRCAHEGLIIRMHRAEPGAQTAVASSFLTTMQHGRETPAAQVWGTLMADEKAIAPDLVDRLVLIERVATMKPEVLAQALKISERV